MEQTTGTFAELYDKDPYLRAFDASVLSCEEDKAGFAVVLTQTAFYPEGGGQPADHGVLCPADGEDAGKEIRVKDVRKRAGKVVHITDAPIAPGISVHGEIDWERRFDHMQQHSGEHILSGLIHEKFGFDNVGFHLSDVVTIDFNGVLTWEELLEREEAANRVIWSNIPIEVCYPDAGELADLDYRSKIEIDGQVRLIRIEGADLCACCGTHVARTGEIGLIKCLSMINYKGGVRIEMLSGRKALSLCRTTWDANTGISHLLSAKPDETKAAVERLLADAEEQKQRANEAMTRYLRMRADAVPEGEGVAVLVEDALSTNEIRRLCDILCKEEKAKVCAVLSPREEGGCNYVIGAKDLDLRPVTKELNEALSGRGGGSAAMVQGFFGEDAAVVSEALSARFGA